MPESKELVPNSIILLLQTTYPLPGSNYIPKLQTTIPSRRTGVAQALIKFEIEGFSYTTDKKGEEEVLESYTYVSLVKTNP